MQLETRKTAFGIGVSTQSYPKTKHFIARIGRVEARVIVWNSEQPSMLWVWCLLFAGLMFFRQSA